MFKIYVVFGKCSMVPWTDFLSLLVLFDEENAHHTVFFGSEENTSQRLSNKLRY